MENFTKVESLSDRENKIKTLIKSENQAYKAAFDFIRKMYKISSNRGKSNPIIFSNLFISTSEIYPRGKSRIFAT